MFLNRNIAPQRKRRRVSQDEPTFHNATTEQPTPLKTQPDILPLKVRIAHVNRSQVDAKWRVLDESSQQQITAMLDLVETTCSSQADTLGFSRPRSTRNSYRRQHGIEVQQATQDLRSRIQNKLQTIPFPASKVNRKGSVPGVLKQTQTSEKEWGLEGLNDLKRNLQGQLTLAQHSVVLLDQETSRETAFLEQDLDSLRALEKNASRQQNSRNEAYRKLHPSLKTFRKENLDLTSPDVELHIAPSQPLNLEVGKDPELAEIMKELSSHLSSLENNVSALAGLGDLVDMTKAKLDDVMYRHLLEDEYAVITDD